MNSRNRKPFIKSTFLFFVFCILLAAVSFPSLAEASSPIFPPRPAPVLPPRPTVTAEPNPGPAGALIELRVQFDPTWVWVDHPWQEMETVVQWQDDLEEWHDVAGWRGGFDEVKGYEGRKSWWLSKEHFGTGPFRWLIYDDPAGAPLAVSGSFYMPRSAGEVVRVVVPLAP